MAELLKGARESRLAAWCSHNAARAFCYGRADCSLFAADWCLRESGIDPAASMRGRYEGEAGWRALAATYGGLTGLWAALGRRAGLHPTDKPDTGDIGIVRARPAGQAPVEFGAILGCNGRWIVKMTRGIVSGRFEPLCAWRVPCPRP